MVRIRIASLSSKVHIKDSLSLLDAEQVCGELHFQTAVIGRIIGAVCRARLYLTVELVLRPSPSICPLPLKLLNAESDKSLSTVKGSAAPLLGDLIVTLQTRNFLFFCTPFGSNLASDSQASLRIEWKKIF